MWAHVIFHNQHRHFQEWVIASLVRTRVTQPRPLSARHLFLTFPVMAKADFLVQHIWTAFYTYQLSSLTPWKPLLHPWSMVAWLVRHSIFIKWKSACGNLNQVSNLCCSMFCGTMFNPSIPFDILQRLIPIVVSNSHFFVVVCFDFSVSDTYNRFPFTIVACIVLLKLLEKGSQFLRASEIRVAQKRWPPCRRSC